MRSLSTEFPRISPATPVPMPGRYKSCRRSTGELFSKEQLEQEQELRRCAELDIAMRVEQQRHQVAKKDQDSPFAKKVSEASPARLTPLKWRSASVRDISDSELYPRGSPLAASTPGSGQPRPAAAAAKEESQFQSAMRTFTTTATKAGGPESQSQSQSAMRPSQAQLRAQVMNSLAMDKRTGNKAVTERERPVLGGLGPVKPVQTGNVSVDSKRQEQGSLNPAVLAERMNGGMPGRELFPEQGEQPANIPPISMNENDVVAGGTFGSIASNRADTNVSEAGAPAGTLVKQGVGSVGPAANVQQTTALEPKNGLANPVEKVFKEPPPAAQTEGKSADHAGMNGNGVATTDPAAVPPERAVTPEIKEGIPPGTASNVRAGKTAEMPTVMITPDPHSEEVDFQPVDLDKKYRDQELVRHYTAAKIQNREEALLNNPSPPGATNIRKAPVGEEPAAMTIEFLRARLQAERSASKATKARMEQLSKKLVDLESKLAAETELRKTAEVSLQDALLKLKKAAPPLEQNQGLHKPGSGGVTTASQAVDGTVPQSNGEKSVAHIDNKDVEKTVSRTAAGGGEQQTVLRVDDVGTEKTVARGELQKKPQESQPTSEGKNVAGSGDSSAAAPASDSLENKIGENEGGLWKNRSVATKARSDQESQSQVTKTEVGVGGEAKASEGESSGPGSSPERTANSHHGLEARAVIEDRLRAMWVRIEEDMVALAHTRGGEEAGRKDGSGGWVSELPFVLQEKPTAASAETGAVENLPRSASDQTDKAAASARASSFATEKKNSFKRNASLAKNVAKLVEQFEFQETAQREWEENFESRRSQDQDEGEPPSLVTRDGEVVADGQTSGSRMTTRGGGGASSRSQTQGDRNSDANGGPIARSRSLGFLPSQKSGGKLPRKGSSGGRIEFLEEDDRIDESGGDDEELLYDPEMDVAEELPNGIYLHHSRAEVGGSSFARGVRESPRRRRMSTGGGSGGRNGMNSPSMADRPQSRERFSRSDMQGGGMQDRASRDMYFESRGGARASGHPYGGGSDREYQHRGSMGVPEGVQDDIMYRTMDRSGGYRMDDRRMPPAHYPPSHTSSDDGVGGPGFREKDLLDQQDFPYRNPGGGHRNAPMWHDGDDIRYGNRGMGNHGAHGEFHPSYGMDEHPHQGMYVDVSSGYGSHRDMPYVGAPGHGMQGRPDHFIHGGGVGMMPPPPGPRTTPMNGYSMHTTERPSPAATQMFPSSWENVGVNNIEEKSMPVRVTEELPAPAAPSPPGTQAGGEANEVLKALRIAKQQIKSATNVGDHQAASAAIMTAQYTVSQEHRIGAGGQVSKTSYTVEAPVGYPRVTKTLHEGWRLDATKPSFKKRGVFNGSNGVSLDLTGANVTDLISGGTPLTGESSYVEKLNVGRGIQFFFSG